jgi:2-octaprenyl-6-methoxyphenol hydroxylase
MSASSDYQVIIIGGGLVGVSLAVALGQSGIRVAIVETTALSVDQQPNYDDRSIALAQGSQQIFSGLGLWGRLESLVSPIHTIHVSDRGHFGFTRLRHSEENVPALGYVAPSRVLGAALIARLSELECVTLLAPAELKSFSVNDASVDVEVLHNDQMTTLSAKLLVAADGAQSEIREQLGIATEQSDYGQTAVIANLTPGKIHNQVAYERFTETGPMAMLPMTEGRCALVWTVANDRADEVMHLDDAAFLKQVQERFGFRLGYFQKAGRRTAFPLQLVRARESVRPRLALIGNAIHTLHPVAGQGFNLGLRDVAALSEVIVDAISQGHDCGDPLVLKTYANWRFHDHRRVVTFTDGLVRLFSQPLAPVRWARNAGLLAFDLLPPAKRWFGKLTMGRGGRLPRLSRGLPLS